MKRMALSRHSPVSFVCCVHLISMRRRAFSCAFLLLLTVSFFPMPIFAARGTQQSPKLLNLFLDYLITEEDAIQLAKWDIVVLDMDQQFQFPERLREMKRLNPRIKLLAYVSASELADARYAGDPASPSYVLSHGIPEQWFLHKSDGSRVHAWPGTSLLNATNAGPVSQGRWNLFIGPFIRDQLMSTGLWDGVFLDAAYGDLTSTFGSSLDPDGDGLANPPKENDERWREGMTQLMQNVRSAIGPDKLIMNNSSAAYASVSNGVLFENFPRYGWAWPFYEFRTSLQKNVLPKISAVNTNTNNQENATDYRLMRYGLTSTLVADGFFSFDAGDRGHHRTWWYDEYEAPIGSSRGSARMIRGSGQGAVAGVWTREYDRGAVFVNSTNRGETIPLSGEFERLRGTQDPSVNSGAVINQVTVPPQDGVILLKRSDATQVRDTAFVNGQFVQVFDQYGSKKRNGFFTSRDDVPGGAIALTADLDKDGTEDVVFSQAGALTIRLGNGRTQTVRPFGAAYRGSISLAIGQTNKDAADELVLGAGAGSSPTVMIVNVQGKRLASWLAYRREFTGGVSVAIGDVDGDKKREMITAPGNGGGPHIRSFRTDGTAWRGGFFAFPASESGGAFIALGDTDGDGRDEIVVGSGPGSWPRVRVYDGSAHLLSEFATGDRISVTGVKPLVTDMDGDGKAEILVPGSPL